MPFTFFSHQAPVVPLKMARPHWFSGTALVVGSMAPDSEYFIRSSPPWHSGHTLPGQFTQCLPQTLVMVWLITRIISRPLALHLPEGGDFHLRDYRVLARSPDRPYYWLKVILCALIGSFSHIAWDSFTHYSGWAVRHLGYQQLALLSFHGHTLYLFKALQHGSSIVGAIVTLILLRRIGQRRSLLHWAGVPENTVYEEPTAASRGVLWTWVALGILAGAGLGAHTAIDEHITSLLAFGALIAFKGVLIGFVGLCIGCFLAGRRMESGRADD